MSMQIENWRDLTRIIGNITVSNELGVASSTLYRWLNVKYNVPPRHFKKIEVLLVDCGYPNITPENLKQFNIILDQEKQKKELI